MSLATGDYTKAQKGNEEAFDKWVEDKLPDLGRFAFQLGIPLKNLPEFQQLILQQFQKELDKTEENQAKVRLYQIVIEQLYKHDFDDENSEQANILSFQEDNELHLELQNLEKDQQISIVLIHFHSYSLATICRITEKTEQQIEELINTGTQSIQETLKLDQVQLKQRFSMLEKSYLRLVLPLPLEQEIHNLTEKVVSEKLKSSPVPQSTRKKTSFILGAACIFLATVVGASFAMNDQSTETKESAEQQEMETITDEKIEEWRNQYEDIKRTSPKRLGITEEQYKKFDYVKKADKEMALVFSEKAIESLKDNPIEMESKVNRLFRQIETPQGMVKSLSSHNMLSSETEDFLLQYTSKTGELRDFVDKLLIKYQSELEGIEDMEQLSTEKLMAQSHNYPEELQLIVRALPEYNQMIIVHPNKERFRAIRSVDLLYGQQLINSDPYASQYLSWLGGDPFLDDSGFLWSLEQITEQLLSMEQALLQEETDTSLYDGIDIAYQQIFWQLVKGTENTAIFDKNGTVKLEYQNAWNRIASSNPMAYIMLPILDEMEASGWTTSKSYEQLEFHHLSDAVDMEKSGELAAKLPNGDLMIEDALVDMKDFDYSRIKDLYNSFKTNHDLQLLAGVPPLDVLFMYHYANEIEDSETQWYLLADSPLKPALKVYQQQWRQIPKITEKARWVELSAESTKQRIKEKIYIYPQVNMDEFEEQLDLMLVSEKDHIWQIDYRHYESHDLLKGDQKFKQQVESLYNAFAVSHEQRYIENAKPSEIAGLFFKAIEEEDVPTMKQLVPGLDIADEEFLAFSEMYNLLPLSELVELTFKSHFTPFVSSGYDGSIETKYKMGTSESTHEQYFYMDKTEKGWRMRNIYKY